MEIKPLTVVMIITIGAATHFIKTIAYFCLQFFCLRLYGINDFLFSNKINGKV